jgi:NAD(P)-dependent dehydrogenase (short-subunit alcohol dehydrogenase family)
MKAPTVLVTGAGRGIGLELVRQYAADRWSVIACCRSPTDATELGSIARSCSAVRVEALDITDHGGIDDLAQRIRGTPIDVLINNAGIMGALPLRENLNRQHFGELDYTLWEQIFRTNTLGSVKMAEAFADAVAASNQRKIVSVSSTTGSIAESKRPALAYTTSKTALNKAMTVIAEQLRPRGIIVALLCPGYVKTRMNVGGATLEIPESVSGLRELIASLTLADSGTFRRYNGEVVAW